MGSVQTSKRVTSPGLQAANDPFVALPSAPPPVVSEKSNRGMMILPSTAPLALPVFTVARLLKSFKIVGAPGSARDVQGTAQKLVTCNLV